MFPIHVFVKHPDASSPLVLLARLRCTYQECFPVPPWFVYKPLQMKHEHWEAYRIHAMYGTPWKTLHDSEFCVEETLDGILRQPQWHYHRRSYKHTAHQHIRHSWRCAAFFTTVNNGAARREGRTILCAQAKPLYSQMGSISETVRNRTHIRIKFFA